MFDTFYNKNYKRFNWAQTEKLIRMTADSMLSSCESFGIQVKRCGYTDWEISFVIDDSNNGSVRTFKLYFDPSFDRIEITPLWARYTTFVKDNDGKVTEYCNCYTFECKPRDTQRKVCTSFIEYLKLLYTGQRDIWYADLIPSHVDEFGKVLMDVSARSWESLIKARTR